MEALSKINRESVLPSNEELTLVPQSSKLVSPATGQALLVMMAQCQAGYPNQQLPEGTPEVYLSRWEEMVVKYSLGTFRDALLKAMHECDFFPQPNEIEDFCKAITRGERDLKDGQRAIAAHDAMRHQWLKEREERRIAAVNETKQ